MSVPAAVSTSRPTGGRHPLRRPPVGAIPPSEPPSLEPLPAHVLADIAGGFASAEPLWSAAVRHDPAERRPVRLIATERYEVWVIGWTTDQHVQVHDHGDSAGAVVVTAGELAEALPDGRGGAIERVLEAGRVRHLAVGVAHPRADRPRPGRRAGLRRGLRVVAGGGHAARGGPPPGDRPRRRLPGLAAP